MMTIEIKADWVLVANMTNADLYAIAREVLAIVPHAQAIDSEASARASVQKQHEHWRTVGHRGAVVVFMDAIIDQESGARSVYTTEADPSLITCYSLVGDTFFGQAMSAVFTGLSKPQVPTNIFRTLEEAMPWIDQMNRSRGGAL
jgi:hypothetical protein